MMKSRKQRKLEAKQNNEVFVPQYNGTGVLSFEDFYGVGNERFNNKFIQFLKPSETPHEFTECIPIEEVENVSEDLVTNKEEKIEVVEVELVKETPKSKKAKKESKFKNKLKKLFNK